MGKPKICVDRVTKVSGSGALKGFCSIIIGEGDWAITINNVRIIKDGEKEAWCSMPQSEANKSGAKKYYSIVFLAPKWRDLVAEVVLKDSSVQELFKEIPPPQKSEPDLDFGDSDEDCPF